jgi:phage terminase large subunit GpA-like protein
VYERNEALDLMVYNLAALYILGGPRRLRMAALRRAQHGKAKPEPAAAQAPRKALAPQVRPMRRGWINGFR